MPTYEYACSSCGTQIDVVQSFTEDPLTVCEVCGGPLRRVFHPVGVLFKGSGFYSTDNKSKKKKGSRDGKDPSSPKESASASSGSKGRDKTEGPKSDTSKPSEKSD